MGRLPYGGQMGQGRWVKATWGIVEGLLSNQLEEVPEMLFRAGSQITSLNEYTGRTLFDRSPLA